MWFLLSLNLSHWIGSFSTVGLDTHLGFSQKGLREANHFHFSFSGEGEWAEREEREGHNFPGNQLREIFSWHASQGSRTVRFEGHIFRGQAGDRKREGDCIYYSPYPARISRPYTGRTAQKSRSVRTVPFCTFFKVNNRHIFRGSILFFGTENEVVQQH